MRPSFLARLGLNRNTYMEVGRPKARIKDTKIARMNFVPAK
jgi:hypothetical protein